MPDIAATIWDAARVSTFIEELSTKSSDGHQPIVAQATGEKQDGDWHRVATLAGVAATVLKSDSLEQFNLDPLWVDLTETSLVLAPETAVAIGDLSCRARAELDTVRQNWTDQGLVTTVRFKFSGSWVRRTAAQSAFTAPQISAPNLAGPDE